MKSLTVRARRVEPINAVLVAARGLAAIVDEGLAFAGQSLAAWIADGESGLAALANDAQVRGLAERAPLAAQALFAAIRAVPRTEVIDAVDAAHETFLAALDADARTRHGVFFTPAPLARFVVRAAARIAEQIELSHPRVVIDPAAGAGIFLTLARSDSQFEHATRFVAQEIHPVTAAVLRRRFARDARIAVRQVDTLSETESWCATDETVIVIGNPPFAGHSASRSSIATDLLRGVDPIGSGAIESYSHIDGVTLGERNPKWLQDDCVKFIRYAQWQLSRASGGVVALVCTHAFVHHPTFRAMRHSLWRAHDGVCLLDLHGNVKKLEVSPDGSRDQNVFDVQQGVAVLLFWRRGKPRNRPAPVRFAEMWGTRESKLARLEHASFDSLTWTDVEPAAPRFAFSPEDESLRGEYDCGLPLGALFTVASPAIVTGRDALLVASDRRELEARLADMRDPSVDDPTFATRHLRARDAIALNEARAVTRIQPTSASTIAPCLYRPFDVRFLLDLDPWIERSRRPVMNALRSQSTEQIALIARRQSPPGRSAPFVFVTLHPAIDGVIRSDNHGSETVFPLQTFGLGSTLESAIDESALSQIAARIGRTVLPREMFAYAYALLHATSYRHRYATFLRQELPRIAITSAAVLFDELTVHGERLIAAHTLAHSIRPDTITRPPAPAVITRVDFANDTVEISPGCVFRPVSSAAWHFAVGGYRPLRKWLEDRGGSSLDTDAIAHYARMIVAIEDTLVGCEAIDAAITRHGGLPLA